MINTTTQGGAAGSAIFRSVHITDATAVNIVTNIVREEAHAPQHVLLAVPHFALREDVENRVGAKR